MHDVIDNRAAHRFELLEQGQITFADYEVRGDRLILPHVEAPIGLRGTGAAGRLMEGVLSIARERGLKVQPICSYAEAYMSRNPEYADLRA
jgi:predicted GNAT family acetyltransferase